MAAIAELRRAGIRCVLVTGRSKGDLERFPSIAAAFDAYALEGGARWGEWTNLNYPGNVAEVLQAADRVVGAGIPIERRAASFSIAAEHKDKAAALVADCAMEANVDRIDILPPRIDKGVGLDGALGSMGIRGAHVVAIGDAENDLPMFARANVALAVANALDIVKDAVDEVLPTPGPAAVIDAARRLLKGDWRNDDPGPNLPAAA
ncbi:MAG TPA: HAD hydrolase family protein [Candidatus Thermoplasmatota archaeon]|nr:HAD hydrolase family protein [Candidatus Thermoplasmatota archaeon]